MPEGEEFPLSEKVMQMKRRCVRRQMAPFHSLEWIQLVTLLFPLIHMGKNPDYENMLLFLEQVPISVSDNV